MVSQQSSQRDTMQSQASSRRGCSFDRVGDLLPQKNSEACSGASGECLQDFSNQFSVDDVPGPQVASIGLMRSQYLSDPYSFSGNSGKLLGTVQQQNESVHVV
ncbi:uncharacterized protein LOC110819958 isoform X2 [Carica papaya]|uniref:uncharacterized protein LOC110819958 isoform X2 n=1 Tax=Carica papaya TaxID=3649 RepID=UPI000B8C8612|nr:uncharacterized protein LOC110819958 isoform X2 [Carica papaya]